MYTYMQTTQLRQIALDIFDFLNPCNVVRIEGSSLKKIIKVSVRRL